MLEGVNFQTSSAKLTPESLAVLDRVVEGLKGSPDVRILIEGHTDSQGPYDANRKLSKARADAGSGTQLDVLDAETSLTQARTTQVQALHDYAVARARLERAIGQEMVQQPGK